MRRADESALLAQLLVSCSRLGARLWRNNCGQVQVRGQWIRYGIGNPGGSDLIGYLPVTITPEMVGHTVAVFIALEAKTATGRVRPEQAQFLHIVGGHGARAGVVRSVEDAEALLRVVSSSDTAIPSTCDGAATGVD
jgi:hypothetical protein